MIRRIGSEDIVIWPQDTFCFGDELEEMLGSMSDDFIVVPLGTPEHDQACSVLEAGGTPLYDNFART